MPLRETFLRLELLLFRGDAGNGLVSKGSRYLGEKEKGITRKEMSGEKRLNWERIEWGHPEVSGSWRKALRLD